MNTVKDPGQDTDMQAMKVAVALAVLRNKPAGISGRDYAEMLSETWRASQLHWKQQYEQAVTELLHLKQQLVINKQLHHPDQILEVESVCSDSQSLFPTPPPSGSTANSQTDNTPCHTRLSLSKHTEFLQHLINIQTASSTAVMGDIQDLPEQSLLHSLEILQNHIGNQSISWRMQEQCVKCIVNLVDKYNQQFSSNIVEKVSSLCANIINKIMSCLKQEFKVLDHESLLLSMFGDSKQLIVPVLNLLCDAIQVYSDHLRHCVNHGVSPDPNKYSNSYYILCAAERCLGQTETLGVSEKLIIRTKLEDSLLHVTEQFPLFAHAVWRVIGRIS